MSKIKNIIIHISGSNPSTRANKSFTGWFSGTGQPTDSKGNVIKGKATLKIVLSGNIGPKFPTASYSEANLKGDTARADAIMAAFTEQHEAWQSNQGGGSIQLQIAKATRQYLIENEGFLENDGDGFLAPKLENMDVSSVELADGTVQYSVGGTAVFGASK